MYEDIRDLALTTARNLAGEQAVVDASVKLVAEWDGSPAYKFTLLVDQSHNRLQPGLLRIRLSQALADAFDERKIEHGTQFEILDREAWDRRAVA